MHFSYFQIWILESFKMLHNLAVFFLFGHFHAEIYKQIVSNKSEYLKLTLWPDKVVHVEEFDKKNTN